MSEHDFEQWFAEFSAAWKPRTKQMRGFKNAYHKAFDAGYARGKADGAAEELEALIEVFRNYINAWMPAANELPLIRAKVAVAKAHMDWLVERAASNISARGNGGGK